MLNGFGDAAEIERPRTTLAKRTGVRVLHSAAAMSKPTEIAAMVREAEARFGRAMVTRFSWHPMR
jgi:3-hydroxybutyrate dehydrogenase